MKDLEVDSGATRHMRPLLMVGGVRVSSQILDEHHEPDISSKPSQFLIEKQTEILLERFSVIRGFHGCSRY